MTDKEPKIFEKKEPEKRKIEAEKREKKEAIKITGFEKFNSEYPEIKVKGERIMEETLKILPGTDRIREIKYINEILKEPDGNIRTAQFIILPGEEKGIIKIYKTIERKEYPDSKEYLSSLKEWLRLLLPDIIHEWAHSEDPTNLRSKDIPRSERIKFFAKWEQIRKEEKKSISYSHYVETLLKKDDPIRKSLEDKAETVRILLTYPNYLLAEFPKRYKFCLDEIKKHYPEFDPQESSKKKKEYDSFIEQVL